MFYGYTGKTGLTAPTMSRSAARALSVLLCIAAAAAGRAQSETPAEPGAPAGTGAAPLELRECVAQALAKNFSVRIQSYSVDQAKAGVVIAQSTYDPVLGVAWQKSVVLTPPDTTIATQGISSTATQSHNESTTATVTQPVITGGTITASYALSREGTNSVPIPYLLNPAYVGNTSLTVTQPLLQGAGTDYNRAVIQRARLGEAIAGLSFRSSVLTTILNVETAYYNLVFARRQCAVAEDAVRLAQELLDENTVKRKTGVLTDLDVVQAEAGLATAKSQLIGFRQATGNAEDTLLQALGEREFRTAVGPVELPQLTDTNASFDFSYKLARENGPNLAIIQATIEQYKLDALRAKRNNLPQLNATGAVGYGSAADGYRAANSGLWPGAGSSWSAGLTFSIPWGMRSNRALYRQAMDSVNSQQVTLDQADQALVVGVRSAVRAVQSSVESVSAAGAAARLSQRQYDLQRAKFDAGLATSYDVLQAQNQLESARVSEIQAQVGLRAALANLRFLEGTSTGLYRVDVKG